MLEQILHNACATCVPFNGSYNNPFICLGLGEKKAQRHIHKSIGILVSIIWRTQDRTVDKYITIIQKIPKIIIEKEMLKIKMQKIRRVFVRTYVFHMLRTYVMILCNWLIP